MTLTATVEFSGLELDRWELNIEHGTTELHIRDHSTLEGILKLSNWIQRFPVNLL
ncbi:MAG: hypothetical protein ACFFDI_25615 [Promethearchaeota archaeon]